MAKFKRIIKWSALTILGIVALVIAFGMWFMSLLKPIETPSNMTETIPGQLTYLTKDSIRREAKVLIVVTSTDQMGASGKPTGYELSELARAYYVFVANGFDVDIASPAGGTPPQVLDDEDMGVYDYAFLNDPVAQEKLSSTIVMSAVEPGEYAGVFFVGGKGTLFDFPNDTDIQRVVRELYESGNTIGAVCHGPSALVNVTLTDGRPLVADRRISGFTNTEELFLIPEARDVFPFLLQDKLEEKGARFEEGTMYLQNTVTDGQVVTGQNPWSTWSTAEAMVVAMGYTPKARSKTSEENAVEILGMYARHGYDRASDRLVILHRQNRQVNRELIAIHSILAAMQWDPKRAVGLLRLLTRAKKLVSSEA